MNKLEFKQIAISSDDVIIALDHRGQVWEYCNSRKAGRHTNGQTAGWTALSMEVSSLIPALEQESQP